MIENIQSKSMKELRAIARQIGLQGIKHEKAEALRARITFMMHPELLNELNKNGTEAYREPEPKQPKKAEINWLSAAQVMEALAPFKDRIKLAFYDDAGNPSTDNAKTWHVKNGVAEDSGTMSISLKWLIIKASEIANARLPAALKGKSRTPILL